MSLKWRRATIDFVLLIILGCGLTHPLQLVKAQEPSNNQNQVADEQTDNFDIKLHSYYRVNANSHTSVEHHFTISNNTPEFFISKYGIIVSSTNLDQITITDDGQTLAAHVSHLPGQTSIGVTFDRNLVGEDKSRELIISYIDQDIAQISGQILELNIPALANPDQYQDYQLDLVVPNIFGTASRIKPETFTLSQSNDFDTYRYQNLAGQAVSAIFGDNQVFDLKLNYILNNPSNQTSLNQITLPPETSKQKVHYHQLDPLPENIKIDEDGNFIATYAIPANNSVTVELLAQVLLTLNDNPLSPTAPVLPEHLQAQKYWELNNERLQSTAASLSGALDINNFVVNTLDYTQADLDQEFTRLGAAAALVSNNLDQATCQEFTDLFIALARLKGIPAKRLVGYAYSSNQELKPISTIGDILHAWPTYYDELSQSWLEIDPTWQDTTNGVDYFSKFDLNHIVFAINGVSSTLPYPAGSYASGEDASQKKVFVTFSQQEFPIIQPQLTLDVTGQSIFKYGPNWHWPGKYTISITNTSGQSWYFAKIQVDSEDMLIDLGDSMPDMIAPFQTITLPFSVYNKAGLINHQSPLSIDVQLREGQSFHYDSTVTGIGQLTIQQPEKILPLAGGLVVFTLTAGSLFLLGRRLASALRRQGQKSEKKSQELQQLSRLIQENQTISGEGSDGQVADPGERSSGTTD